MEVVLPDVSHSCKGRLIPVTERVYSSTGYALSNVLYVVTDQSVVVIDTTESVICARASFVAFRRICSLPVSYIIFTHHHSDHTRGAKAFHSPGTNVIAHSRLETERAKKSLLAGYRLRADILQFGLGLPLSERGITHNARYRLRHGAENGTGKGGHPNYVAPTITFDDEYRFTEGGTDFELYHAEGESYDHLIVWLPEQEILFPGDLFYRSFPMLCNPLKPARPILSWAESLDRMRAFKPKFLVPSHGPPMIGACAIEEALGSHAEAIRYIYHETVRRMNEGQLLEQICREVRLPIRLAENPYLQERYGTVCWAVRGVFQEHAGWYTWHAKDLKPSPSAVFARALIEACGSPQPVLQRARRAFDGGEHQLALELTELLLAARPRYRSARILKMNALRKLAEETANRVERNIYLMEAKQTAGLA